MFVLRAIVLAAFFVLVPVIWARTGDPIVTVGELYKAVYELYDGTPSFDLEAQVSLVNYECPGRLVEFAVEDPSGAVNLMYWARTDQALPKPGDRIRAKGHVRFGNGRKRCAQVGELTVIGHGPPPDFKPASLDEALSGRLDFRPIEVRATLRDALVSVQDTAWTRLGLLDDRKPISVSVLADEKDRARLTSFIGHEVVIRGFCSPADPGPLRNGRQIRLCDPQAIQLSSSPQQNDFPPAEAIENLDPSAVSLLGLHRVSGIVVATWQRKHALIKTHNGKFVRTDHLGDDVPHAHAEVTVVGFPESNFINLSLINARTTSSTPTAVTSDLARDVPISNLSRGPSDIQTPDAEMYGMRVRTHGYVRMMPSLQNNWHMLIEDSGRDIVVESEMLGPALEELSIGCKVSVSGVFIIEASVWRAITFRYDGAKIIPSGPEDIAVLSRPSWWTVKRLMITIGALVSALCAVLLWNALLRKAAARKGRELAREQLKLLKSETKAVERSRLAVELHDSLAQNLTGVSLEMTAATQCGLANTEGLFKHLSIATRALDSCRHSLRDSLWDLRNRALEERDMNETIRKTLQPHIKGLSLALDFAVPRNKFSDKSAHAILCIIRELVLNGIRHGHATSISIEGRIHDNILRFSVSDNGCGFDPNTCPGMSDGHFGIEGMKDRLKALAGTLAYEFPPSGGVTACVTLQIPDEIGKE